MTIESVKLPDFAKQLGQLRLDLEEAWCRETSYWPETWTPDCPSHGQCAVTAAIVCKIFYGRIVRGTANGVSHYWNWLGGGEWDLTAEQFQGEIIYVKKDYVSLYKLVPSITDRYNILKTRLEETNSKVWKERHKIWEDVDCQYNI